MIRRASGRATASVRIASARSGRAAGARRPTFERLEDRSLLSTIVWDNDGGVPGRNDPDSFGRTFGPQAGLARAIVRQAIRDWEQVIVNFNYINVGQPGFSLEPNTFHVNFVAGDLGGTTMGDLERWYADASHVVHGAGGGTYGKPYRATVAVDDNGGAAVTAGTSTRPPPTAPSSRTS